MPQPAASGAPPEGPAPAYDDAGGPAPRRLRGRRRRQPGAAQALARAEAERLVDPERVVGGVGDDHEPAEGEPGGGVASRLVNEPAGDPTAAVAGRRVDRLEASAAARREHAAAGDDSPVGRVERGVPGTATGRKRGAPLRLAGTEEALVVRVGREPRRRRRAPRRSLPPRAARRPGDRGGGSRPRG